MSDTLHHMMMFFTLGTTAVVAVAAIRAINVKANSHDDHVDLEKSERDTWYELVATFHNE